LHGGSSFLKSQQAFKKFACHLTFYFAIPVVEETNVNPNASAAG